MSHGENAVESDRGTQKHRSAASYPEKLVRNQSLAVLVSHATNLWHLRLRPCRSCLAVAVPVVLLVVVAVTASGRTRIASIRERGDCDSDVSVAVYWKCASNFPTTQQQQRQQQQAASSSGSLSLPRQPSPSLPPAALLAAERRVLATFWLARAHLEWLPCPCFPPPSTLAYSLWL